LLQYGYHGVYALSIAVEDRIKADFWKEYVADLLCLNVRPKYDTELSLYSEIFGHEQKQEPLSTDQIIDGILDKLDTLAG